MGTFMSARDMSHQTSHAEIRPSHCTLYYVSKFRHFKRHIYICNWQKTIAKTFWKDQYHMNITIWMSILSFVRPLTTLNTWYCCSSFIQSRVRFWAVQNLFCAGWCPKLALNQSLTVQNCPKPPKTVWNCQLITKVPNWYWDRYQIC